MDTEEKGLILLNEVTRPTKINKIIIVDKNGKKQTVIGNLKTNLEIGTEDNFQTLKLIVDANTP